MASPGRCDKRAGALEPRRRVSCRPMRSQHVVFCHESVPGRGPHFWTAHYFSGTVYKYDIVSGHCSENFPRHRARTFASGLAVVGEPTAAGGNTCPG